MPRYYFDIHDGELLTDDEGTECKNFEEAREKVVASLPDIAIWISATDGEDQAVSVIVRNEAGAPIYTARLAFSGLRLSA